MYVYKMVAYLTNIIQVFIYVYRMYMKINYTMIEGNVKYLYYLHEPIYKNINIERTNS